MAMTDQLLGALPLEGLLQTEAAWYQELLNAGSDFLPFLLAALAILVVGYVIALIAAAVTRRALHKTNLDERLMDRLGRRKADGASERAAGKVVFWAIMFFVILGAFQALGLSTLGEPLNAFLGNIFAYLPNVLGAIVLGLIAWGVATVLKRGALAGMQATNFDERVGRAGRAEPSEEEYGAEPEAPTVEGTRLSESLATGLYWLVILLFLPAILGALQLGSLVEPVNVLLNEFMAFLPNLVGAAAILVIGWFVARIVRNAATNVLHATGLDDAGERWGMGDDVGEQRPSELVGLFLYVVILIPVVIGALDALGIEAVTAPAQNALNDIVGVVPDLAAAAGILLIAYLVARVVADLSTSLLAGVGVDNVWSRMGMAAPERGPRLSRAIGVTLGVVIVAFAAVEAAAVLGFDIIAGLFTGLLVFAGRVALGVVILGAGLWLANLAAKAVRATNARNAGTLATIAQGAVIVFATGMALQEIGLASELVLLTFGLALGAAAVAGAIAFGLGGREVAEEELREWRSRAEAGPTEQHGSATSQDRPPAGVAGGED